jgi:hypothetical protein
MLERCENPQHPGYKDYGGRGITVCEEWHRFFPFYSWSLSNGYAEKLTIDRIDNGKGYNPNNCRWITQKKNSRNRRNNHLISWGGESLCISEWAERLGISPQALVDRLHSKSWSLEQALTLGKNGRPIKQPSFEKAIIQLTTDGSVIKEWESISKAAEALNIPNSNISRALKNKKYTARGFRWEYASGYKN